MIKPIPQFEVWQSSRYLIFFESKVNELANSSSSSTYFIYLALLYVSSGLQNEAWEKTRFGKDFIYFTVDILCVHYAHI